MVTKKKKKKNVLAFVTGVNPMFPHPDAPPILSSQYLYSQVPWSDCSLALNHRYYVLSIMLCIIGT